MHLTHEVLNCNLKCSYLLNVVPKKDLVVSIVLNLAKKIGYFILWALIF